MSPGPGSATTRSAVGNDPGSALWHRRGPIQVLRGPGDLDAAAHAALGPALLRSASSQGTNWLRVYRPPPTAAFTGLDRLAPGYGRAREVAAAHGFSPVRRGSGGRVAAYHAGCLCVDVVLADARTPSPPDPWAALAALAGALIAVLRRCGVDARSGEVPGEYCPGRFSVNVDGRVKLAGTAARRIPGATLLGAVLVVDGVESIRDVTTGVYAALPFLFEPSTVGGAAEYAPGLSVELVESELLALAGSFAQLVDGVVVPAGSASTEPLPTDAVGASIEGAS